MCFRERKLGATQRPVADRSTAVAELARCRFLRVSHQWVFDKTPDISACDLIAHGATGLASRAHAQTLGARAPCGVLEYASAMLCIGASLRGSYLNLAVALIADRCDDIHHSVARQSLEVCGTD